MAGQRFHPIPQSHLDQRFLPTRRYLQILRLVLHHLADLPHRSQQGLNQDGRPKSLQIHHLAALHQSLQIHHLAALHQSLQIHHLAPLQKILHHSRKSDFAVMLKTYIAEENCSSSNTSRSLRSSFSGPNFLQKNREFLSTNSLKLDALILLTLT